MNTYSITLIVKAEKKIDKNYYHVIIPKFNQVMMIKEEIFNNLFKEIEEGEKDE